MIRYYIFMEHIMCYCSDCLFDCIGAGGAMKECVPNEPRRDGFIRILSLEEVDCGNIAWDIESL